MVVKSLDKIEGSTIILDYYTLDSRPAEVVPRGRNRGKILKKLYVYEKEEPFERK